MPKVTEDVMTRELRQTLFVTYGSLPNSEMEKPEEFRGGAIISVSALLINISPAESVSALVTDTQMQNPFVYY